MRKTTDNSIPLDERVTVNAEELSTILGCGRSTATRIGIQSGARIQIGKRVLYKVDKIKAYLDTLTD